jgi:hypothetical protein
MRDFRASLSINAGKRVEVELVLFLFPEAKPGKRA